MKVRDLQVSTPTGEAGHLLRESQHVFNYTTTDRGNEVSLTMPIRARSYVSHPLMPVFSMNLPEGYLFDLAAADRAPAVPSAGRAVGRATGPGRPDAVAA